MRPRKPNWRRRGIFGAAMCVAAAALYPALRADYERFELDDAVRASVPGYEWAALEDGVAGYRWHGPEDGPIVVMVHGLTTPSMVWDRNVPALTDAGFRVLRLDLYGRGWSDRPDARYGLDMYVRQIDGLLDANHVAEPVSLVGLSMGGGVVAGFTAAHPERVGKLVMLAPAGLMDPPGPMRIIMADGFAEYITRGFGDKIVLGAYARMTTGDLDGRRRLYAGYELHMQYKGYRRAVLQSIRNFPLSGMEEEYRAVGAQDREVLLIWGSGDSVVPYRHHEEALSLKPNAELATLPGAGHQMNMTRADQVNQILIAFLHETEALQVSRKNK